MYLIMAYWAWPFLQQWRSSVSLCLLEVSRGRVCVHSGVIGQRSIFYCQLFICFHFVLFVYLFILVFNNIMLCLLVSYFFVCVGCLLFTSLIACFVCCLFVCWVLFCAVLVVQ